MARPAPEQLSAALKAGAESEKERAIPARPAEAAPAVRPGVALCLSGGGFRAALFHLGALRRLNELRVLSRVTHISAVSGGSILAAHLARAVERWPEPGQKIEAWDERVAEPFKAFVRRDLRTWPILARWLLPWNWFRTDTSVQLLAGRYQERLRLGPLAELPARPAFVFCATDMVFGVNWEFRGDRVGDYLAGYLRPAGTDWTVARAVAASSCFPPVFPPLVLRFRPGELSGGRFPEGPEHDALVARLRLTDGGVYDNLAIEPVWGGQGPGTLLVSDGGGRLWPDPAGTVWRQITRYMSIVANQTGALRRRWLIASYKAGQLRGAFWGISSAVSSYEGHKDPPEQPGRPGYSKDFASTRIAAIRTDMDGFTPEEIAILENHGYTLADAAIQTHAAELKGDTTDPLTVLHDTLLRDERAAEAALADSDRRVSLRRMWRQLTSG